MKQNRRQNSQDISYNLAKLNTSSINNDVAKAIESSSDNVNSMFSQPIEIVLVAKDTYLFKYS